MNPWDLFNPANFNPLDPQQVLGQIDGAKLVAAAEHFPGGPGWLVFALFFAPVGPGIPAGVLLSRHAGLNPLVTICLYAITDVLGALMTHPMYAGMRRLARHVGWLRWLGQKFMKIAMFGARVPTAADLQGDVRGLAPALFRIGTVGFGLDVYHGGMLVAGLPVPRILGWGAAIAGDLVWFAVLLVTSIITAAVVSDDRIQFVVMMVAMFVLPVVAKRVFPALRDPTPAARVAPPVAAVAAVATVATAPPWHDVAAVTTSGGRPAATVAVPAGVAASRPRLRRTTHAALQKKGRRR